MNKQFSASNPEAQGPAQWALICRKMIETDSTIAAAWEATSSTLLSCRCYAKPGDETNPLSVKMADLLNQNLGLAGYRGRMKRSFESCLSEMLKYLLNGFRYGEIGWDLDEEGRYYIAEAWLDHDPAGHDRWDIDPGTNHLLGVWQRIPSGDLGRKDHCPYIPGYELVYLGRHATGADYDGIGVLQHCYSLWKAKEDLIRSHSEALNRSFNPTLNVVIDRLAARIDAEKEEFDWEKIDADLCDGVEAILDYVLSQWGSVAIPRWVKMNYGNVPSELHPVMKHSGLDVGIMHEQLARLHEKLKSPQQ